MSVYDVVKMHMLDAMAEAEALERERVRLSPPLGCLNPCGCLCSSAFAKSAQRIFP